MFLNIITPCSRPENLLEISKSINIPKENYRWIVVFDSENFPDSKLIPENCESYHHKNFQSTSGNAQRNYAIDLVKNGHIYFNDDDTLMHPELWDSIKNLSNNDFISFQQVTKDNQIRLIGDNIAVGYIDSHNFITSYEIINDTRFILNRYDADGYFAVDCFSKSKKPTYLNKVLSIYNLLR
jgi:hypothetical protein